MTSRKCSNIAVCALAPICHKHARVLFQGFSEAQLEGRCAGCANCSWRSAERRNGDGRSLAGHRCNVLRRLRDNVHIPHPMKLCSELHTRKMTVKKRRHHTTLDCALTMWREVPHNLRSERPRHPFAVWSGKHAGPPSLGSCLPSPGLPAHCRRVSRATYPANLAIYSQVSIPFSKFRCCGGHKKAKFHAMWQSRGLDS